VGVYLYAWAIFTVYMFIASLRTTIPLALVFLALLVTLFVLAIAYAGSSSSLLHFGGWCGIVTAALAWFASAGFVINSTFGREVVPIWPIGG
jgi:succinate-acetate transporter protein